ncbi:helix-turn-helix domain-containing protein [Paenarthrobacter sp. TA1.8]|uniref:helix-turn-helix domain-containing protein n=1 Tax=Paenarthrobacter sp. TA1.8 TaxID=3400219 RepID=UPI003B427979
MSTSIDRTYQLFTVKDLTELFQVSRSTIYRLRERQGWPHIEMGNEIRFSLAHIAAIHAMNEIVPPKKQARSTKIGTARSRAYSRSYNIRNGLKE